MASGRRLEAIAEAVLLAALVLAPWPYGCAQDFPRYALATLVSVGLLLFALARVAASAEPPALSGPVLGLAAVAALQLALGTSAAPLFTAEAALLLLSLLGAAVFWSERARSRGAALRLAAAVLLSCTAQAAFGALQWQRSPEHIYGKKLAIVTMPFGSYVNHNHFAGLIAMGTLVAAGLALGHTRQHRTVTPLAVGLGGLSLALAATLLASRSRGGLLALLFGLTLLGFSSWALARSRRRAAVAWLPPLLVLGLLGFALAVVPAQTRSHLASVLRGGGDLSSGYRLDVARDTLRLALSRPLLGSGLGAFADAFPAFKRAHGEVRSTHAESDALEFLAEGGLVGLLALAWLFWSVGKVARERLTTGHDALRRGLLLGALGALGALAAHSLFDFNLRLPANALLAASLVGLVAAPRAAASGAGARRGPALVFCAGVLLVALACGWRAWGGLEWTRVQAQPRPLLRLTQLDKTLRFHPYLDVAWRERGLLAGQLGEPASVLRAARLSASIHDLRLALRLRPRWAEVRAELGRSLWLSGDVAAALAALAEAQTQDPTHAGVAFLRAHIQGLAGDHAGAVLTLSRLLDAAPGWWPQALAELLRFTRDPSVLAPLAGSDPIRQVALRRALESPPQP